MRSELRPFVILSEVDLKTALAAIDANKKGFLLVCDSKNKLRGVLTDGDIRRSLIKDGNLDNTVKEVKTNSSYEYITTKSLLFEIIDKFKDGKINFLPIVNEENKLVNILTKRQLHVFMFLGEKYQPDFPFHELDDSKLEHEIFARPWGIHKTTFLNEHSRAKILQVLPGEELSLQEHKKRDEHWVVIKGDGQLTLGEYTKEVKAGDYIFIPRGCKHQIGNVSKEENLMISEVQLGDYFGEDDIIRYKDKYARF